MKRTKEGFPMETMKQAPIIRHSGRRSNHTQMALDAAKNVRLSKRATKLFMIYEDSMDGFRPTLKFICDRTGIAPNKVSEIRAEFVRHGLIRYADGMIYLDWERIRLFAGLEKPLPKQGSYGPVQMRHEMPTMKDKWGHQAYAESGIQSALVLAWCRYLEGLPEVQFRQFLEYKPSEHDPFVKPRQGSCFPSRSSASPPQKEGYITHVYPESVFQTHWETIE